MDPDLQMDIITELDLVNTTLGVTQVSGLHNASKAFLFQGKVSSSFAGGRAWGGGLSGESASGVCVGDPLCCFSCVTVTRNVQKCRRACRYGGRVVTVTGRGGTRGHGGEIFGLAVKYFLGDFGGELKQMKLRSP